MIASLDSATPPTATQVAAAKAAGIGMWAGYVSEIPQRDGLYRPWTPAEFDVVRAINPHPIAYTSGWDDPVAVRKDAANRGYRLCLDVERLIRDNGPWVQPWLDASGAGLYGTSGVHVGRRAAFHIAAWYVSRDPATTWPASWPRPPTPCGWQWQNTHTEFGVPVDRNWLDDVFGGHMTQGDFDALVAGNVSLQTAFWRTYTLLYNLDTVPNGPNKGEKNALKAELDALKNAAGGAKLGPATITGTITPQ